MAITSILKIFSIVIKSNGKVRDLKIVYLVKFLTYLKVTLDGKYNNRWRTHTSSFPFTYTLWSAVVCEALVVSSSSQPHLPDCCPIRVSPASLPLCPHEAPFQPSWAHPGHSFYLPVAYFPVWTNPWAIPETLPAESLCAGLDGTVDGGHPGCVLSFSELHPCLWLSPLGWQYSQGDRTTASPASLESPYSFRGYSLSSIIIQPFMSLGQGHKHFANCS